MKHCLNLCKTQSCFILAVNNCCQIIACWFPRGEYFTYVPPPDPDFQLSFTVSQVVWTVDLRRSHLNQTLIFLVDFHLLQATKWSTRLPQTYLITTFSLSIFSSQFSQLYSYRQPWYYDIHSCSCDCTADQRQSVIGGCWEVDRIAPLCQHWQITVFPSSLFAPSCKTNSAWRCGIYAIALLVQPLLDNMTPCLTSQEVSMDPILSIRNWVLALNWDISVKISQQRAGQWT